MHTHTQIYTHRLTHTHRLAHSHGLAHTQTGIHTHSRTRTHTRTGTHTHRLTHIRTHIHGLTHIFTHANADTDACAQTHAHMFACMHACDIYIHLRSPCLHYMQCILNPEHTVACEPLMICTVLLVFTNPNRYAYHHFNLLILTHAHYQVQRMLDFDFVCGECEGKTEV